MIKIYDNQGSEVLLDVLMTKEAVHEEEMMVSDHVRLSWSASKKTILPAGSYIIPFPGETDASGAPLRFFLLEPYEPTAERESVFKYTPQFSHPVMLLSKTPFIHLTGDTTTWETATKNYEWTYTGPAGTIAAEIARYINQWGSVNPYFMRIFGSGWTAEVSGDLPSSASLSFNAYDVLSAASEAASKFGCEYHFDFRLKVFHFGVISYDRGRTELDEPLELHVGRNVSPASVTASKEAYYNRYVVRGGTRNLSKTSASGENVQITERLTLPSSFKESAIDLRGNMDIDESVRAGENEPMLTGELVFDDVYPKIELYIYNPRERRCYLLDENGDKVPDSSSDTGYKMYSKWYIRLAYRVNAPISGQTAIRTETEGSETYYWYDFPMSDDLLIKDKTLSLVFHANQDSRTHTSPLSGREFELVWFKTETREKEEDDYSPQGFTAQPGDYRIIFVEENGVVIPTTSQGGLYPKGDAIPDKDNNKATLFNIVVGDTYKTVAQTELYDTAIKAIRRLRSDLNNYTLNSYPVAFRREDEDIHVGQTVVYDDGQDLNNGMSYRLTTHIRKIVTRLDNPYIKEITVGNEKKRGTISSMQEQINTIILGGGGSGDSGFTADQIRQLIDSYASLRFLSKLTPDTAQGRITFAQGTASEGDSEWGDFLEGATGAAIHRDKDGQWHVEADYLHARRKLTAKEIQIEEVSHVGGQMMLTAAEMVCDYVEEHDDFYRCYFLAKDEDGKTIHNKFKIGDQAIMQSFDVVQWSDDDERQQHGGLRNRYYWRLVVGTDTESTVSDFNDDFNDDFGFGGTLPDGKVVEEHHWIDLSKLKDEYAEGSDAPMAEDNIVQLGYRGNDSDRQNAIVLAGAGTGSPYIDEYEGIDSFSLEGKVKTRIKPGDNRFTGLVQMFADSTYNGQRLGDIFGKYNNDIKDLGDSITKLDSDINNVEQSVVDVRDSIDNLASGNENLLRNTGFTGDYTSMDVEAAQAVNEGTPIYSDPLQYWAHDNAQAAANVTAASGFAVEIAGGYISQQVTRPLTAGQTYCVSFRAKGSTIAFSLGGCVRAYVLSSSVRRYTERIVVTDLSDALFRIYDTRATVMEIMVTEGNIPNADWIPSPLDNDKTLAYYQDLVYLANAIANASTSILGGLILTQMIRVGNYRDGAMTEETGGMSGLYTSGNSPFLWGGGDMQKAFYTINKYLEDPSYQATDEEVEGMAKFVVTHGGRAILNDIILRGYVYAKGGYFKGEVVAEKGVFKNVHSPDNMFALDEDGRMSCKDAQISGSIYTPMYIVTETNFPLIIPLAPDGQNRTMTLSLTGLNVQLDYAPEGLVIVLPREEQYLGARVNILNNSGVTVRVMVNGRVTIFGVDYAQLQDKDFGTFYCYQDGSSYVWIRINS